MQNAIRLIWYKTSTFLIVSYIYITIFTHSFVASTSLMINDKELEHMF